MKNMKILFQGDSITDAGRTSMFSDPANSLGLGYPMFIDARLGADYPKRRFEVINRGISGHRVVDLYARWKSDTLNLQPDMLSILIGVNDTWHEKASQNGVEVERYAQFYDMLLEWTTRELPKCKLVLCEPFILVFDGSAPDKDWVKEIAQRAEVVSMMAKKYDALFIPLQKRLEEAAKAAKDPSRILGDGVHPTAIGHQIIADIWIKDTDKLLNGK